MVNQDRLLGNFIKMVQTASPSGKEGRMKDLLVEEFARRGLAAIEDQAGGDLQGEAGNLLVKIDGDPDLPALLFVAHMDTVEPGHNIVPVIEGGVVRSSGDSILGADDKAAIAALLEVADVLQEEHRHHPPLELLFTVGEEQGLQGAKLFDFSCLRSKMGYALDSGGPPGSVVIKSPCQNEIEYRVYGRAAHAGINPQDGINAIQAAARALAAMPCGRIDPETTCNFGQIEGGVARNIVAPFCRIKGEARSLHRDKLDKLTQELGKIFMDKVEEAGGRAEMEITFLYPEIQLDPEEKVVALAVKAAQDIGLEPRLISTGGGSDASVVNGAGIRCANLGTGMSAVHTCDEYITVEDLINNARWVLAIIDAASTY